MERTLSILKPDVIMRGIIGRVISYIEHAGLRVIAQRMCTLSVEEAREFYKEHKTRKFFEDLINFMTSGPVIVQVLEGNSAISVYRDIMGATDPKVAASGTIRGDLADSVDANCVHGSDSVESAEREVRFFFPECELFAKGE